MTDCLTCPRPAVPIPSRFCSLCITSTRLARAVVFTSLSFSLSLSLSLSLSKSPNLGRHRRQNGALNRDRKTEGETRWGTVGKKGNGSADGRKELKGGKHSVLLSNFVSSRASQRCARICESPKTLHHAYNKESVLGCFHTLPLWGWLRVEYHSIRGRVPVREDSTYDARAIVPGSYPTLAE